MGGCQNGRALGGGKTGEGEWKDGKGGASDADTALSGYARSQRWRHGIQGASFWWYQGFLAAQVVRARGQASSTFDQEVSGVVDQLKMNQASEYNSWTAIRYVNRRWSWTRDGSVCGIIR